MAPIGIQVGRSWGRYPAARHARAVPVTWRDEPPALDLISEPMLPYGCGRSYGDSCLNDGGALLVATGLDRFIALEHSGLLRCEAGVTLAEILDVLVPRGWFPPVVPGT
jgi:FAD/FMN-containing dehydrogenase